MTQATLIHSEPNIGHSDLTAHEIPWIAPFDAAVRLRHQPGFVFLDSSGDDLQTGRYSFVAHSPFGEFVLRNGIATWCGAVLQGAPLDQLREILAQWQIAPDRDGFPFRGGCIGHMSYDLGQYLEKLEQPEIETPTTNDLRLGFYDVVCAFDRKDRRAVVFSSGFPHRDRAARAKHADLRLKQTLDLLRAGQSGTVEAAAEIATTAWQSNFAPDDFKDAIESVRKHILNGDIYQANLTQRFAAQLPEAFDAWSFYRKLRAMNPAPFSAFLFDGDTTFASSSPERFLSLRNGTVEARPIKGTIRRDVDPVKDRALAAMLEASEKDQAENTMIVDLLRNDLSRVCKPGSVDVPVLCGLETYASVHHLTSVVRGQLQDGYGAVDLIAACFPGGSITGAPKIRAMDIITDLEKVARGVYCGSIGYIGFDGAMDLSIVIRTAVIGDGKAVVQAGGGITLLSDPTQEYEESLTKADRLFAAFAAKSEAVEPCC